MAVLSPSIPQPETRDSTREMPCLEHARQAQRIWSAVPPRKRLQSIRGFRHLLVAHADEFAQAEPLRQLRTEAESLAAEVIPLADACRFLERNAARLLKPEKQRRRDRPLLMAGVDVEIHREPFGVVLLLCASNYPLFLMGVQAIQALAAGNAVLIKPGIGATEVAERFVQLLPQTGIPDGLVSVLPESIAVAEATIRAGVDKVVLTGSVESGRNVSHLLSEILTPCTLELSGNDAVFVLPSADLDRLFRCIAFGLTFNASQTCIAPRRVFITPQNRPEFLELCRSNILCRERVPISSKLATAISDAVDGGANFIAGGLDSEQGEPFLTGPTILDNVRQEMRLVKSDIFAPVCAVISANSPDDMLSADDICPYALGASVFGADAEARSFARRINAGCIVINDLIAPTADPRVPFGGRDMSGHGVTRGAAGLLEMTQIKAVVRRRGRWLPHLRPAHDDDAALLSSYLKAVHGHGFWRRMRSALRFLEIAIRQKLKPGRSRHDEQ